MKHFFFTGFLVSMVSGAIWAVDSFEFVFRYLFFGMNIALLLSVFCHSPSHIKASVTPMHVEEENVFSRKEKGEMRS